MKKKLQKTETFRRFFYNKDLMELIFEFRTELNFSTEFEMEYKGDNTFIFHFGSSTDNDKSLYFKINIDDGGLDFFSINGITDAKLKNEIYAFISQLFFHAETDEDRKQAELEYQEWLKEQENW